MLAQVEGVEFPLVALDAYYRAAGDGRRRAPDVRRRVVGLAGHLPRRGSPRHLRRHHAHAQRRHRQADHRHPAQRHQLHRGDRRHRRRHPRRRRRATTAPSGRCSSSRRPGDASSADGNEDGTTSPFNLYDATLAAATYLCTASSGLDADPGLRAAYFSYNHSVLYVDSVLGYARLYERSIEVPEHAA